MRRAVCFSRPADPAGSPLFAKAPVALAVARLVLCAALVQAAASPASVWAQTPEPLPNAARLKSAAQLDERMPGAPLVSASPLSTSSPDSDLPTFVFGNRITGRPELDTQIDGNAELRRGSTSIRADRIDYWQPTDTMTSRGDVRINRAGDRFEGTELQLAIDRFEGFFLGSTYRFLSNGGNGSAERVDFIDAQRFSARQVSYTTCQRGNEASWQPAWVLRAERVDFDMAEEVGTATGAVLRFKNVPILGIPKFTFPLSDKRKSGFLPPTLGLGSTSGFEYRQPYYVNIAPNQDATVTTSILSKRGLDVAGEYRYLAPSFRSELRGNVLPGDRLRQGRNRWSYVLQHAGSFDSQIAAVGRLGLNLNLNRVSDNDYWRDFSVLSSGLPTQRLLSQEASLSWNRGFFNSTLRYLKWQTLQDPLAPIVPPYDRVPQLNARYSRVDAPLLQLLPGGSASGSTFGGGFDTSIEGDTTRFSANRQLTGQPNGRRSFVQLQLSRPWVAPAWYITPKIQLHATSYQFDTPLADGAVSARRVVPTFSLDSGLQFEREAAFLGRNVTQTLEPRAFYVRTPYRNQQLLPNYDSAANDFNFATVFTENAFVGNDRFSEANLLTLGLTSRLLDPATGAENMRFGIAQRLRFDDQRVTLPGQLPTTDRISDFLAGTSINWVPQWGFDSTVQYNPKTRRSERASLGVRYSPSNYRTISASVRQQRGTSRNIDIGWQWPINDLWGDKGQELGAGQGQGPGRYYSVGRLNYSVLDKKFVDAVVGIEYDGCCWIGRVVLQRSQNSVASTLGGNVGGGTGGGTNTRILFQLELLGFSRLGSNPLGTLQSNVPRYQVLREKINAPSRFTTYD